MIHAGIYYAPGSLRAKLCVQGSALAYSYFDEKGIPYKKVGKLIVAVEQSELARLEELFRRAQANGCRDVKWLDAHGIQKIEPNCRGLAALFSPHTGIVDWGFVTQSYAEDFKQRGGFVYLNFSADRFKAGSTHDIVEVYDNSTGKKVRTHFVITAAGLQSDRVSSLTGCSLSPRIVPFRGDYLQLKPEKSNLVTTNIYPVPDPRFPFLGVHFTPRMDGSIWCGPNAGAFSNNLFFVSRMK